MGCEEACRRGCRRLRPHLILLMARRFLPFAFRWSELTRSHRHAELAPLLFSVTIY
jgi:hypothetical protein